MGNRFPQGITQRGKIEKQYILHRDNEKLRSEAIQRQLVAACHEALQFREMMKELLDPLKLESEKHEIRGRWKKAELAIRLAIQSADGNPAETLEVVNENPHSF